MVCGLTLYISHHPGYPTPTHPYSIMAPKGPLMKAGLYSTPAIAASTRKIMTERGLTGGDIGSHSGASITTSSFCGIIKHAVGSDIWNSLKNPEQPVRNVIRESKAPKTPKAPRAPKTPKAPKAPKAPKKAPKASQFCNGLRPFTPFSGGTGIFQRAAKPAYVKGTDPNMDRMYNQMFGQGPVRSMF